jgi:hypothetical protein
MGAALFRPHLIEDGDRLIKNHKARTNSADDPSSFATSPLRASLVEKARCYLVAPA